MAVGKGRNKRSSGNSCASTATTVVFVTLCLIGVYMLTPNSLLSSNATTTRTAISKSEDSSSLATTTTEKTSAFQDNPGDLPDDATKTGRADGKDSSGTGENVNDIEKQETSTAIENNDAGDKQEAGSENGSNDAENDSANTKDQMGVENVKRNPEKAVEENPEGLQGNVSEEEQQKLNENEIQLSEESVMTHNQEADQEIATTTTTTTEADDKRNSMEKSFRDMGGQNEQIKDDEVSNSKNDGVAHDDSTMQDENQNKSQVDELHGRIDGNIQEDNQKESRTDNNKNPRDAHNEILDDNEQHMEQHQQHEEDQVKHNQHQEEEQSQHDETTTREVGTSNDQIQHDEAPIDQQKSNQETVEEEKGQTEKKEPQHDQSIQNNEESKHKHEKKRRKKHHTMSDSGENNSYPSGESSEIPKESKESKKAWSTQADESEDQKGRRKGPSLDDQDDSIYGYTWHLCNVTAGTDYIPCLDNEKAINKLRSRKHFEHRERHCPEEAPTCLVPLPHGYKIPVEWPRSRDKIWYHNVPHTKLAEVKGHQNWVKLSGEFLTFPGGGTQFIHGALHYIDFLQEAVPEIAWGKHTRTVLDVGCGVASFGGYLFDRDVLAMSFAPKDEHEAQVQFALERGIPAISAVMGSQRLPFPSRVFDLIHCARCRVPWHVEGGALLLELNRMLRPGGYFVWSATPVYQKLEEDVNIWKEMSNLTVSLCWELVTIKKDKLNMVGAAIYHKPDSNECYEERKKQIPPMCKSDDDPNAAWYVPLQSCMHRVPVNEAERGSQWPQEWPYRLQAAPYWLNRSQIGIYGKPSPDDFAADYKHWQKVVSKSYLSGLGITWSNVRNIMDMRAVYGGFAAALKDLNVWVLNVVNIDSADTLPIIYERGLFGIYHDWCESFSTYPRSYDLLHADHLFSRLKKRCKIAPVMAEIDRIVRPGGKLIVRDESGAVGEVENLLKSLHWEVHLTFSKNQEGILSAQKSEWRPETFAAAS